MKLIHKMCPLYDELFCKRLHLDCLACGKFDCRECRYWNGGEGCDICKACNMFKNITIESKTSPQIQGGEKEEVEDNINSSSNIPMDRPTDLTLVLHDMDNDIQATMLLQNHFLKMSHDEIAEYHNKLYSRSTVSRMIKKAKEEALNLHRVKKINAQYNNRLD